MFLIKQNKSLIEGVKKTDYDANKAAHESRLDAIEAQLAASFVMFCDVYAQVLYTPAQSPDDEDYYAITFLNTPLKTKLEECFTVTSDSEAGTIELYLNPDYEGKQFFVCAVEGTGMVTHNGNSVFVKADVQPNQYGYVRFSVFGSPADFL